MAARQPQPQPLNWTGISVETEWNSQSQNVDKSWECKPICTIFLDCSIDDSNILKNDVFLEGESTIFENDLKTAVDIGLDFVGCLDEDGSTTFILIVTFVDENKIRKQHQIVLHKVLRLNKKKRKLRPLADMWKDMTQAKVSLSQKETKEIIKKLFGNKFLDGFENMTNTEMLDLFKSDWFLSEPPNPSPGEQMEYATASSGGHNFKINSTGVSLVSRDSGPNPQEVIDIIRMLLQLRNPPQQVRNIIQHLLSLFNGGLPPVFITTVGNTLDPATNPSRCSLYSLLFVNFRSNFLSGFNGLEPTEYILRLLTQRDDSDLSALNQKFHCNIDIGINAGAGAGEEATIARFNGFKFDMRSNVMKGGIDGANASIQYDKSVYTQSGVDFTKNSVSKEFGLSIGGNNEKNAQLIKLLTTKMTSQMKAKMLSAIILKGFGDPNQLLFNIADVLYYSLLRFQEFLKKIPDLRASSLIKTLHGFFIDTLSKCLLITCDAMLARLAVAFRFPVALQKGKSVVHFTFKETDEAQKARCAFITKKESAKNKMNAALKILAKCGNYMSLYLITSSGTTPFLANSDWFDLSQMIKSISSGINKHILEIDALVVADNTNPLVDTENHVIMLKKIEICDKLYSESLVTKNTTSVPGSSGQSRIVYHINYKMALAIAENPFLIRTKKCHTKELAIGQPDYQEALNIFDKLVLNHATTAAPTTASAADADATAADAPTTAVVVPAAAPADVGPAAAPADVVAAAPADAAAPAVVVPAAAPAAPAVVVPAAAPAAPAVVVPAAAPAVVVPADVVAADVVAAATEPNNDLKKALIGLRASNSRKPTRCKVDRRLLSSSIRRDTSVGGSGGKSNKYIQRGGQKTHITGKYVEALVGPTFLINKKSMSIPFVQRNVLLFLCLLSTKYKDLINQYLGINADEQSNIHFINIIDETVREFIAVLTTLENNEKVVEEEEEEEVVKEEGAQSIADIALTNLRDSLNEQKQEKRKKKESLNKNLEKIQLEADLIDKILIPATLPATASTNKRTLREEDTEHLQKLQKQFEQHKSEYQNIEEEVTKLETDIESLNLKIDDIHRLLVTHNNSREKLKESDKNYKRFKEEVNLGLAKTDTEIEKAVTSLLAKPQILSHVSAVEGEEAQLSQDMKDFADVIDAIIQDILNNPHVNNTDLFNFVNKLIEENDGELLANLYLSLFIDLETQYTVSLSKSPERFNIVNKGVTLSASLEASVAREFPDDSPRNESIRDGVISFSIEPRRPERMDEEEGKEKFVFSTPKVTPVTFDVSILLELIESMICDLWSFDEFEFPEYPGHQDENGSSSSKILILQELQSIELLIQVHETKTKRDDLYQVLITGLSRLRYVFNMCVQLSSVEQYKINEKEPSVATSETTSDRMGSADSSEEEIRVPSFIDYATSSIASLVTCIEELNLVINTEGINMSKEYLYIRPSSNDKNEQQHSQSPDPSRVHYHPNESNTAGVASVSPTNLTFQLHDALEQMDDKLANGGESQNFVGGRPITKKSTHRKPRRHTRNYQSHNKRKYRSRKKSTIKHHKSYRKHNRTIKRHKNSRRNNH